MIERRWKGPAAGLSQQPREAREQPDPGSAGDGGSGSDDGEAGRHHQTTQCSSSETERRNGSEPVVEPPSSVTPAPTWWVWAGSQRTQPAMAAGSDSEAGLMQSVGGREEGLRRTRGDAAGEELGADPDNRHMVNVGTTPGAALPAAQPGRRRAGPLSADARRWGGGSVVVRGRESRPHGEGTQRASRKELERQEVAGEHRRSVA